MGSKDIGIGKSEFVAKTQFLYNQIYLILTCKRRARVVVVGFQILVLIKGINALSMRSTTSFILKKLKFSFHDNLFD